MEGTVAMSVAGIVLDSATQAPIVVLSEARDDDNPRYLAIWIGQLDAAVLALELQGPRPPRPLTHDLLSTVISEQGGSLEKVEIADLQENTYLASLYVNMPGKPRATFECSPTDALMLALKHGLPIHVNASLLETNEPDRAAGNTEETDRDAAASSFTGNAPKDEILEALRKLRPEDFKYKM